MVIKIPQQIKTLMETLVNNGFEAYIIGGAVRDWVLGLEPKDYDIFTDANGEELKKLFPNGNILGGEKRQQKILTLIVDGVEISQYRKSGDRLEVGGTLKEHCSTCDLTINAMAIGIEGKIIDYFDGYQDIKKRLIKCVGNPEQRFKEDYLRVLRAIRFASKYKFDFEGYAYMELVNNIKNLKTIPIERIREEFLKIIKHTESIKILFNVGFIKEFLPELYNTYNVQGGNNHNECVHKHCIETYKQSVNLTDNYKLWLACLLHDIGKANTLEIKEEKVTFYNHEVESSRLAKKFLNRWKFSKADTDFILTLIETHMQGYGNEMTKKSYIKFFNKLTNNGVNIYDWHLLRFCDSQGNLANPRYKYLDSSKYIIEKFYEFKYSEEPFKTTDLKINGNDLINLGYSGKDIGKILNLAFNLVLDAKLKNNRVSLMEWLQEYKRLEK
jgi:tRNA nucleotidyltransferase (CCA-adding enzyme)